MKKKTPKNSRNGNKKAKESKEKLIVSGIFVLFIAVVASLFYFMQISPSNEDTVAIVNGDKITRDKLDWWYTTSILPDYRDVITKQDFLMLSLIPQEVLVQKAEKENIKATEEDVEKLLGLFIIENGLTLDEFEDDLNSKGISLDEIKSSFKIRAVITKLLEKENIQLEEDEESPFDENNSTFQEYLSSLVDNSDIKIFPENIDKLILKNFEETKDKLCDDEQPVIRMYTTSKCEVCKESGKLFQDLVINSIADGSIQARHWSLDTGDNLLTLKKENGIPKEEVSLFKKYSPNNLVPAITIGCKYKYIGKFSVKQGEEFKDILKTIMSS